MLGGAKNRRVHKRRRASRILHVRILLRQFPQRLQVILADRLIKPVAQGLLSCDTTPAATNNTNVTIPVFAIDASHGGAYFVPATKGRWTADDFCVANVSRCKLFKLQRL